MKGLLIAFLLLFPFSVRAEIQFAKKKIQLGGVTLNAEIADNSEKTARGLMFRQKLEEGNGMLFVFPDEEIRTFWMKNTFIPLSIGFFDKSKKLIDIQEMEPVHSEMQTDLKTYPSAGPAMYALEVPPGWFKKHKVKLGAKFTGY